MTTNVNRCPNHLYINSSPTVGYYFGGLKGEVTADKLKHHPHLVASFVGEDKSNLRIAFDPRTAMDLAREITQAFAKFDDLPDCSGAAWDGDES